MEFEKMIELIKTVSDSNLTQFQIEEDGFKLSMKTDKQSKVVVQKQESVPKEIQSVAMDEIKPAEQKEIKKDAPSRLHARRQMLKVFYPVKEVPTAAAGRKKNTKDVDMVDKMFTEIAPKYVDRNGGYTRIIKIGPRKGDAAMEVVLELV